jgi:hypothetical protein
MSQLTTELRSEIAQQGTELRAELAGVKASIETQYTKLQVWFLSTAGAIIGTIVVTGISLCAALK